MPDKCSLFKFKNQNHSMRVPFEVSADSESSTEAIGVCEPSSDMSFTNQYQKKKPCGLRYHIVCFDDKLYSQKPVIHRANREDDDVAQIFIEMLKENIKNIHEEFNLKNKMVLSDEGRRDFNNVAHFWICKGSLNNEKK